MRKTAVFLDRDGVLTVERGYISPIGEVALYPYARESIRIIHEKGYLALVVTNQSGVARGLFTEVELIRLHERLQEQTGVDAIYYCPHHIDGIVREYAIDCKCRKPRIGLINRAKQDFEIDMEHSYMVGDRASDIRFGQNAGLTTVLLESGYGMQGLEESVTADYVMADLREFAEKLK